MNISWIRKKILSGDYLWSMHADVERRNDNLEIADVEKALTKGKILETYPEDPRGKSSLVYGYSKNQAIHIVCGKNKQDKLVIITVYKPTLPKWKNTTERNK